MRGALLDGPGAANVLLAPGLYCRCPGRSVCRESAGRLGTDCRGLRSEDSRGEIVLITGPSRTADIEKILILGVHGPKRLVVLLVG